MTRRHTRCSQPDSDEPESINYLINTLPARQRTRAQTAAYLLGASSELPDVNKEEINRMRAVQLSSSFDSMAEQQNPGSDLEGFVEKGKLNLWHCQFKPRSD